MTFLGNLFSLDGKVAVVTGGTGVLGSAMAQGLARAGAKVGIFGCRLGLMAAEPYRKGERTRRRKGVMRMVTTTKTYSKPAVLSLIHI